MRGRTRPDLLSTGAKAPALVVLTCLVVTGLILVAPVAVAREAERKQAGTATVYDLQTVAGTYSTVHDGLAIQSSVDPQDLAVQADGSFVVADPTQGAISVVSPSGGLRVIAGEPGRPGPAKPGPALSTKIAATAVASAPNGDIYASTPGPKVASEIVRITLDGSLSVVAPLPAEIDGVTDLTIGPDGSLYATGGDRVIRVTPNGTVSTIAGARQGSPKAGPALSSPLFMPSAIAVDAQGDVYVSTWAKTPDAGSGVGDIPFLIVKIDRQGILSIVTPEQLYNVGAVALDAQGGLYVSGSGVGYRGEDIVMRLDDSGLPSKVAGKQLPGLPDTCIPPPYNTFPGPSVAAMLLQITAMTFDAKGDLLVGSRNAGCGGSPTFGVVSKISDGDLTIVAGSPITGPPSAGPALESQLSQPSDVAIGPDGTVYIADEYASTVVKVAPDGQLSLVAGVPGMPGAPTNGPATASHLGSPAGLTLDPHGNVYVADEWG